VLSSLSVGSWITAGINVLFLMGACAHLVRPA
jgi:hypothetical protein